MNFTSYLNVMVEYQSFQNTIELDVKTQLLNTNDRKLIIKVAKFVY